MATVYYINKGINKPIVFKGLKAQYIGYLAVGLVGLAPFIRHTLYHTCQCIHLPDTGRRFRNCLILSGIPHER